MISPEERDRYQALDTAMTEAIYTALSAGTFPLADLRQAARRHWRPPVRRIWVRDDFAGERADVVVLNDRECVLHLSRATWERLDRDADYSPLSAPVHSLFGIEVRFAVSAVYIPVEERGE